MVTKSAINLPPLENGDQLSRHEFERRYTASPHLKKAELIEGVVHLASPVRITHGRTHACMMAWITDYWMATPGLDIGDNVTVRLDLDNEPQPDIVLRIESQLGGNSRITKDQYIEGAPELIVEIAGSTASYDLNTKLKVYRRSGVQEYIVWTVYENQIVWFSLENGEYIPLQLDSEGIIYSRVFPGLNLAVAPMLRGALLEVIQVLQLGINSPEHQAFLEQLNTAGEG